MMGTPIWEFHSIRSSLLKKKKRKFLYEAITCYIEGYNIIGMCKLDRLYKPTVDTSLQYGILHLFSFHMCESCVCLVWCYRENPLFFVQESMVTNPAIWLVLSTVQIFLSLTTVMVIAGNSTGEIVMLVNFHEWTSGNGQPLPFLHFHWRLIDACLSLFTFNWHGKSL